MGRNPDNLASVVDYYHYHDARFPGGDLYYANTEWDLFVYTKGGMWMPSRYGQIIDVSHQCTHPANQDQKLTRLAACPAHLIEFVPRIVTQYYTHPTGGGFFARRAGQPYCLSYSQHPGCGWLWKHYAIRLHDFQKLMDQEYMRINLGEAVFPDLDRQISEGLVSKPKLTGKEERKHATRR